MSDNKSTILRFEQAFADNDVAVLDELCSPALVDHNPAPGQPPTLDGFKATIAAYEASFPGKTVSVDAVIVDGDDIATRWTVTGTHDGEFFGVPATGKQVTVEGMNFYRVADGRVTDVWTQFDGIGMLQQIGAIPVDDDATV